LTSRRRAPFHELYGEFYGIWKLERSSDRSNTGEVVQSEETRADLLTRACTVEGQLESTLVRLACERTLTTADIETLGRFRQLFQRLRESISAGRHVPWWSSNDPEYVAFKTLSTQVAALIVRDSKRPTPAAAAAALQEITSNKWETKPPSRADGSS